MRSAQNSLRDAGLRDVASGIVAALPVAGVAAVVVQRDYVQKGGKDLEKLPLYRVW